MKESFDSKDFELIKVDTSDGHEDYWFKVHGAAKETSYTRYNGAKYD